MGESEFNLNPFEYEKANPSREKEKRLSLRNITTLQIAALFVLVVMIMAVPVESLHLRSSRGRGKDLQSLAADVDENEVSSHLHRKKLAHYYSTLVSRIRQSLPSSFRLKLIVLAGVVVTN
jgi:hypothetical protein